MQIAICYHEDGSEAWAGRIGDRLRSFFGPDSVSLPAEYGAIADVERSSVLLLVIGPEWLDRTLGHPVESELAAALRSDTRVIPAVVGGSCKPDLGALPVELQPIATLAHIELRHPTFEEDVGRLLDALFSASADLGESVARQQHETVPADERKDRLTQADVGDGTSVVAFAGATLKGPADSVELLESLDNYRRVYGGFEEIAGGTNHMAYAAEAFFNNGGRRLLVSRAVGYGATTAVANLTNITGAFKASSPGSGGNGKVIVSEIRAPASSVLVASAQEGTVLRASGSLYVKSQNGWIDEATWNRETAWEASKSPTVDLPDLDTHDHFVMLGVRVQDACGFEQSYRDLALDTAHTRWLGYVLGETALPGESNPVVFDTMGQSLWPGDLLDALFSPESPVTFELTGGQDGVPTLPGLIDALDRLGPGGEVDVVAAPGSGDWYMEGFRGLLTEYAERTKSIAVMELRAGATPEEAVVERAGVDSVQAMLCYPWVWAGDSSVDQSDTMTLVPPTGFLCGLLARNDPGTGVPKALTNQLLRNAVRPETAISEEEEDRLISHGINCIRAFPDAGCRLRGGRLASSNPQWQHVNVRRYRNYLERSIEMGLDWTVFEPYGEKLWSEAARLVTDFLRREWQAGRLVGVTEDEAYFVSCDEDTMTEDDVHNCRLILVVGLSFCDRMEISIDRK